MPSRFKFTEALLEELKAPDHGRMLHHDTEVSGLVCRVTAAGSKSLWLVRWVANGQRWMALGDYEKVSVVGARALANQLNGRIAAGERPWVDRAKIRADEKTTAGDLWEAYLADHSLDSNRPNTVRNNCWLWGRVLAPALSCRHVLQCPEHSGNEVPWSAKGERYEPRTDAKGKPIAGTNLVRMKSPCPTCNQATEARWIGGKLAADITGEAVKGIHKKITNERGLSVANRAVVLIQTIFARAAPNLNNPGEVYKTIRHQEFARERHMSGPEVGWFWEAVSDEQAPWGLFFAIAATVGARKSNVLAMAWPSIKARELNLTTGEWIVPAHKSKGGKPMSLYLAPVILDQIKSWRTSCSSKIWVFPHATDPERHAVEPSRAWDRIRWRMEHQRLLLVLATVNHWPADRLDTELAGLPELAERFWRAALGRRESSTKHPLHRVMESLRDRVIEAGADPDEGSVMDLTIHDIRRSVGAHLAMAGHTSTEIGKMLGHSPGSKSTRIYERIGKDHAKNMAAHAAALMLGHNPRAGERVLGVAKDRDHA